MKYVVIGGVAGGATAAARMRRDSEKAEIVLFEKGKYISYANCGLPYYIGGTISDRNKLFVQTAAAFSKRFNIDVRIESEVLSINRNEKYVTVKGSDGAVYKESYDKLLLSPGAVPVVPPLPGIDSDGIFTLRNVTDADRIKDYINNKKIRNAVVIGAGFIGLEMAENLHDAGAEVAIVEMLPQVMAPVDFTTASIVHEHLIDKGVQLYLEKSVIGFEKSNEGVDVILKSGERICTDMVILSIGVRANTKLAVDAHLEIGEMRGIKVNEYLQTSDIDIYAVGDAIEYTHPITGKPWLNYLAGPANRQGRIVADNMVLDSKISYEGSIGTSIAKVFDMTVGMTGMAAKRLKVEGIDYLTATIHGNSHAGYYPNALPLTIKIIFDKVKGRILGAQVVGYDGVDTRIDEISQVIKRNGTIYDLMELEQAYAPPFSSAKDPAAVSAYVASNILLGKMNPLYWRELRDADLSNVTLIDVRTPDEYHLGHIEEAVNIPLDEMRDRIDEISDSKPIWVYCGVGLRGYLASNILLLNGFKNVRNLIGGLKTYNAATRTLPFPKLFIGCDNSGCKGNALKQQEASIKALSSIVVDACGISCPGPILKLKNSVKDMKDGEILEVVATDPGFPTDARAWCESTGNKFVSSVNEAGKFKVLIQKENQFIPSETDNKVHSAPSGKTFIMFSDDLDKALATFVLANGAAAIGGNVSIFFTFWGLNVIKKVDKPIVKKDIWGKMFGMMLPSSSLKLKLSKMNMMGMGSWMMRLIMKKKNIESLEDLRQQAIENGVEFIACQMSMDVMGVKREELLDNVTIGGVATYMNRADKANVNLFI